MAKEEFLQYWKLRTLVNLLDENEAVKKVNKQTFRKEIYQELKEKQQEKWAEAFAKPLKEEEYIQKIRKARNQKERLALRKEWDEFTAKIIEKKETPNKELDKSVILLQKLGATITTIMQIKGR